MINKKCKDLEEYINLYVVCVILPEREDVQSGSVAAFLFLPSLCLLAILIAWLIIK